ncbi:MAG: PIG-L deacetylase family protein [Mycobacteriales bacterium]
MDDRTDGGEASRALVVTAHPDDLDFGAGATVAAWTRAGIEVAFCLVTDGDAGQSGTTPRDQVVAVRQAETRAAARELGVTDVTFLGYPDSRVEVTLSLRRDISRQIRRFRPDRVLTWAPERTWDFAPANHPDHRAVGEATMCAVYPDAANPHIHPELFRDEGWAAWRATEAWLMAAAEPTSYVDTTDTFEAKLAALRAHSSQTGHMDDLAGRIRASAETAARTAGLPAGRLAETFRVMHTGR